MYTNCRLLLRGLCFFQDRLVSCCNSPLVEKGSQAPPLLVNNYKGEIIPPNKLFEKIHSYSNIFKDGDCHSSCKNCYFLENKDWDEGNYIEEITIANFTACNAKCIYCANTESILGSKRTPYPIMPLLKYYKDMNIIKEGVEFHISGGEFSIYKESDAILREFALTNFAKTVIFSNCIQYSEMFEKSMDCGNTYIINSLDCGSRELYKRIKGLDVFNQVVDNLKRYGKNGENLTLKYIIIPSINDNIKEFIKFLDIAEDIGVRTVSIEIEGIYTRQTNYKPDEYFIYLAEKMKEVVTQRGFSCEFYSFIKQSLQNTSGKKFNYFEKLKKTSEIKNNKMFKKLYAPR